MIMHRRYVLVARLVNVLDGGSEQIDPGGHEQDDQRIIELANREMVLITIAGHGGLAEDVGAGQVEGGVVYQKVAGSYDVRVVCFEHPSVAHRNAQAGECVRDVIDAGGQSCVLQDELSAVLDDKGEYLVASIVRTEILLRELQRPAVYDHHAAAAYGQITGERPAPLNVFIRLLVLLADVPVTRAINGIVRRQGLAQIAHCEYQEARERG